MKPLLVFDTETTGLTLHPNARPELQPRAVEFGGVYLSLEDGSVIETFEMLINPEMPIPPEATKVHGITDADVANVPNFRDTAPRLAAIFEGCHCAIAHNAPFDKAILKHEAARSGVNLRLPNRVFCTIDLYREAWGKEMKLTALYESVVGVKLEQKHRGLSDVQALVEIIQRDRLYEVLR